MIIFVEMNVVDTSPQVLCLMMTCSLQCSNKIYKFMDIDDFDPNSCMHLKIPKMLEFSCLNTSETFDKPIRMYRVLIGKENLSPLFIY